MCHHNTFLIYGSIEKADQRRWEKVTHISLFTSFLLAVLFGMAGYSTFTGYSEGTFQQFLHHSSNSLAFTVDKTTHLIPQDHHASWCLMKKVMFQ